MNEWMEIDRLNRIDEERQEMLKEFPVSVKIKRKIYNQIGFKSDNGTPQCFDCDAKLGGKLYKSPRFKTFRCEYCGRIIKARISNEVSPH